MMKFSLFVPLLLALLTSQGVQGYLTKSVPGGGRDANQEDAEFHIISNPHEKSDACSSSSQQQDGEITSCSASSTLDWLLEPHYILTQPMAHTQSESLLEMGRVQLWNVPVPLYRMKQPARLSAAELEFEMILVRDLTTAGHTQVQAVDMQNDPRQYDSWFPGYAWSPLVLLEKGNDTSIQSKVSWKHVGWKFTATSHDNELSHFYALLVRRETTQEKVANRIGLGGFAVPGWMAARVGTM